MSRTYIDLSPDEVIVYSIVAITISVGKVNRLFGLTYTYTQGKVDVAAFTKASRFRHIVLGVQTKQHHYADQHERQRREPHRNVYKRASVKCQYCRGLFNL